MRDFVVLAATDFSDSSFDMLNKASRLADTMGARLCVAHVIEDSFFADIDDNVDFRGRCWESLGGRVTGLKFENFYCKKGNIKDEISKLAKELDAYVVIIGAAGESSVLEDLFVGSHTKDIIRGASSPVLIIKNALSPEYKRILFPTDFSDESRIAVKKAADMFSDAKLVLLNLYTVPFESKLSNYYGFSSAAIDDFQDNIRSDIDKKANIFIDSLSIQKDRVELRIMKGRVGHRHFMDTVAPINADLICLHTTGIFSFFAFDILESSSLDVLMYKF